MAQNLHSLKDSVIHFALRYQLLQRILPVWQHSELYGLTRTGELHQRPHMVIQKRVSGTLLEIIALSAVLSFPRLLIHNTIFFINTSTMLSTREVIG